MERMLDELQTQDLIRLYMVDNERYVFIPRFKQRLRFVNSKFPTPPNEINDLVIKKSDSSHTKDSPKPDSRPPKLREVKRREEKITTTHKTTIPPPPDGVSHSVWDDFVKQRQAKRASITYTAIQGIEREAKKAKMTLNDALQEICARGWTGFKAEWVGENKTTMSTDIRDW